MERVMIVGGGYAGSLCATRIGRRGRGMAEAVLVDPRQRFVERVRLHELAASGDGPSRSHEERLGRDVRFVQGSVREIDFARMRVVVEHGGGTRSEAFDRLVIATGSATSAGPVPGAAEHALACGTLEEAQRLSARLSDPTARRVVVVGGGLTGVELATELAERRPDLSVQLLTSSILLPDFGEDAREHARRALSRLGVRVFEHTRVRAVLPRAVAIDERTEVPSDVTAWAGGLAPSPLARSIGLAVDDTGAALVGARLESASHERVHVVGDAAVVRMGADGRRLRMACATATPMGAFVADDILRSLRDEAPIPFSFGFAGKCVSLGRGDGMVQGTDREDGPTRMLFSGRVGAFLKEMVCRYARAAATMERRGITYRWFKASNGQAATDVPRLEARSAA